MKKYFKKTVASLLFLATVSLASGFCFQGMFDGVIGINKAQAAPVVENIANDTDACGGSEDSEPVKPAAPTTNHNNALMLCCVDGSHTGVSSISQSIEPVKAFPLVFSTAIFIPLKPVAKTVSYHTLITSPPELISVRTTILRI